MLGFKMKNVVENSTMPRAFRGALSRFTITALCGSRGSTSKSAIPSRRWYWPTLPKLVPSAKVRTCVTWNRTTRPRAEPAANANKETSTKNVLGNIGVLLLDQEQEQSPAPPDGPAASHGRLIDRKGFQSATPSAQRSADPT